MGVTRNEISKAHVIQEFAPQKVEKVQAGKPLEAAYKVAAKNKKETLAKEKLEKSAADAQPMPTPMLTLAGIVDKKMVGIPYSRPKELHQFNRTNDAVDWASLDVESGYRMFAWMPLLLRPRNGISRQLQSIISYSVCTIISSRTP